MKHIVRREPANVKRRESERFRTAPAAVESDPGGS
jgi:hypothetical protein